MNDMPIHHGRYDALIRQAATLPPLKTAVVHPCSPETLRSAVDLKAQGVLDPVLVGPRHKIRAVAEAAGISLAGMTIEPVEHSHAAADRATELASTGSVGALMKGSLHSDELLSAVVGPNSRLKTERRMSHVYLMDVPAYDRLLAITDAVINIKPDLDQKRDICQNAVDFLRLLGIETPKVAVLAAVETVNSRMQATLDAAALTVMSARGQITDALVDGPLAFDNAINVEAKRAKCIASPVAGYADILLVPDIEAGNILAKQLIYFAGADAAGLVLGARVPIILTSRADSARVRTASAVLAKLVAAGRKETGGSA
ncbi:bifunctional enoyl-CoA hydratase/phosphate acetyltransferase [Rhizobium sp. TRM95111]|uniref:bifunctional enoyl-CoA hydratase/phosphate acetyltransferase n=1 Tax=Rhizobium alarense TaxID=2846851 RepID=UPI001F196051|nr:bifunctional enoyl-CoA hydratase/phosphate acetyltransferase [Rhizobium alarense]MCF3638755.1 bifunctional enoyl-CoA hydratase/phosphate acetyltransferase [Rhizobium alarense]